MRNRRVGTGEKINWADVIRRFPRFDYGTGRQALFLSFSLSLAACAGGGRCNTRIDDPVHYRRSLARSRKSPLVPRAFLKSIEPDRSLIVRMLCFDRQTEIRAVVRHSTVYRCPTIP